MENTALACTFTGCTKQTTPEKAMVPAIQAIKQVEGGRNPSPADLPKHVYCEEHAELARHAAQIRMYSYLETRQELERRATERQAAKSFFAKYAMSEAAKPKPGQPASNGNRNGNGAKSNAMQLALQKAGVRADKQNSKGAVVAFPSQ